MRIVKKSSLLCRLYSSKRKLNQINKLVSLQDWGKQQQRINKLIPYISSELKSNMIEIFKVTSN